MTIAIAPLDVQFIVETLLEDFDSPDSGRNHKRSKEILQDLLYQWRHSVKKNRIPEWALRLEEELKADAQCADAW